MKFRLLLIISLVFLAANACAEAKVFPFAERYIVVKSEAYSWREFYNGAILLKERGMRFSVGVDFDNLMRRYQGFLFQTGIFGYFGSVYYDGHAQDAQDSSTFYQTSSSTDYVGVTLPLLLGYRFTNNASPMSYSLYAGGMFDSWMRNIRDTTYGAGFIAQGYQEYYQIASAKLAVGVGDAKSHELGRVIFGIRYPLFTQESLSLTTNRLSPGKQPSLFGEWILPMRFIGDPKTLLTIYYESYRFSPSPFVGGYQQPQSHMDALGVSLKF